MITLKKLAEEDLKLKLIEIEKTLFELRLKKATRQNFKSHEFSYLKCQRAQILTLLNTP